MADQQELTSVELMGTIVEKMEDIKAIFIERQVDTEPLDAKLALYTALYTHALDVTEDIGSADVADTIVQHDIIGWNEAVALARVEGWIPR